MISPITGSVAYDQRLRRIRRFQVVQWGMDHWLLIVSLVFGVFILLPFVAPVLMHFGLSGPARLIYTIYVPFCHQMAQRSFFLFGNQAMYDIGQLPVSLVGSITADMNTLRAFLGNSELGWKVAWSDRMVYMYGAMWVAGLVFYSLKQGRYIRPLPWWGFVALTVPMALDGGTHVISDAQGGLAGGFRYYNQWLAELTGYALPEWFYVGDRFGSFNAWMRLISGVAFGVAVVWLAYPYLDRLFTQAARDLQAKLDRARIEQQRIEE